MFFNKLIISSLDKSSITVISLMSLSVSNKSAGTDATVFSHGDDGVKLKLTSGKFTTLNPKNRAMIGTLAGGGSGDRPLMRAGVKWRKFRS